MAREITATILPQAAFGAAGALLGLAVHFTLSVALGLVIGAGLTSMGKRRGFAGTLTMLVGALIVVWVLNFLVGLPMLNPQFLNLMPWYVSLASKVAFAIAMALVLRRTQSRRPEAAHGDMSRLQAA